MTAPTGIGYPTGIDYLAARFLTVTRRLEAAEAAVARVEALLAHARLVSPSQAMTVYVADVAAALNPPETP